MKWLITLFYVFYTLNAGALTRDEAVTLLNDYSITTTSVTKTADPSCYKFIGTDLMNRKPVKGTVCSDGKPSDGSIVNFEFVK